MSATLVLHCGGCEAEASVPLRRRYETLCAAAIVVGGESYDRCAVVTDDPEDAAPDGWVVWDPYTFCTYCPTCWASIESAEGPA